mgnify:CR=1 FL=1
MGSKEDSKYTNESDRNSQVRNIITQLNAETPSREKSREVVTRADGSKSIRVVKKRKMLVSRAEKERRGRRGFVKALLFIILFAGLIGGFFAYRVSQFSSDAYYSNLQTELARAWGAEDVRFVGARLDGMLLRIDNVVATFPQNKMVERLEISELSCPLTTGSFFTGVLKTDEVKIARATLVLPEGVNQLDVPQWNGENIWEIKRISCQDFSCYIGSPQLGAVSLEHVNAYMYYPGSSRESRVVVLRGGTINIKGMRPMEVLDAKVQVTPIAVENIRVRATPDITREKDATPSSTVTISGHFSKGASLSSPLELDTDNFDLSEFTNGRYSHILNARTMPSATGTNKPVARIILPFGMERPRFEGAFALRDIKMTPMPIMTAILEHIEPARRRLYLPLRIDRGRVSLSSSEEGMTLSFNQNEMRELDVMSMDAELTVNQNNELSGYISYGIPASLTHVEYPDGLADPLFRDDGTMAWVRATLSGTANAPSDNTEELEAAAAEYRKSRPVRTPFHHIDVDALVDHVQGESSDATGETETSAESENGTSSGAQPLDGENRPNNGGNSPVDRSNPFEDSNRSPFDDSGLSLPENPLAFPLD